MISLTSEYALRAAVYLARLQRREPESFGGARDMAAAAGVPGNYLGKILQQLARAKLLQSRKGFGGGFRLARPAGQITLLEIIAPIERVERLAQCPLGHGTCTDQTGCALHTTWKDLTGHYLQTLRNRTLGELIAPRGVSQPVKPRRRPTPTRPSA
jgi:Rrf2 family protein